MNNDGRSSFDTLAAYQDGQIKREARGPAYRLMSQPKGGTASTYFVSQPPDQPPHRYRRLRPSLHVVVNSH